MRMIRGLPLAWPKATTLGEKASALVLRKLGGIQHNLVQSFIIQPFCRLHVDMRLSSGSEGELGLDMNKYCVGQKNHLS
jgi:hypothetical protein